MPFDFGEETVDSGDPASVTCTVVKGDLPVEIVWLHNDKIIKNENGVSILNRRKVSTLDIDSVSPEDVGVYTCLAKNAAGSTFHAATLNVNGTI